MVKCLPIHGNVCAIAPDLLQHRSLVRVGGLRLKPCDGFSTKGAKAPWTLFKIEDYMNFKSFLSQSRLSRCETIFPGFLTTDLSAQQECAQNLFPYLLLLTSQSSLKELNTAFHLQQITNNDKKDFHNITRSLSAQSVHGFYGVQC